MKLSIAICHAPFSSQRSLWVAEMVREIRSYDGPELVDLAVIGDGKREGCRPTAHRAWREGLRHGATHHLVLTDDAQPCRDFVAGVLAAIEVREAEPLCFYGTRKILAEAYNQGDSWAVIDDGCWGVATCLPVAYIEPWMEWEQEWIDPSCPHDDSGMAAWLLFIGMPVWVSVPSLVEHRGHSTSLLGQNNKNKVATNYIGADQSALAIDWTRGLAKPLRQRVSFPGTTIRKWVNEERLAAYRAAKRR